ncbi:hypothetical protein [Acidovorax sp. sic0104]|uniref:hypothetical protein n=1 Tax=Acidovorax sp. sic0104 TaxID=2854784 RepID=UPI001C466880|nr:hypothetical protein [Acidovorax sp. sic0104]MBV7542007.1 hypothetical protein [Acidovorax sp. sic0104]
MGTPLHKLVASHAGPDPAMVVSNRLLVDLLTRRLVVALNQFVGHFQQYPDLPAVQIGLDSCSYQPGKASWKVKVPPGGDVLGLFFMESSGGFQVRFAVTKAGDKAVQLFDVELDVVRVTAHGNVQKNVLSLGEIQLDFRSAILPAADAAKNAADLGLTERDVARLEGLVAGSIAPTTVRRIFGGSPRIDLRHIFPTVVFNGNGELAAIDAGLLIVARNGWTLDEGQRCPCGAPPVKVDITPPPPVQDEYDGSPLPVDVKVPPSNSPPWPVDSNVAADVGLYLPDASIKALTGGPYPAIAGFANDEGFFGWEYDYTVAFTGVSHTLKDPRATIVLDINFYVEGNGSVNVDIPCFGRTNAGNFWANNREAGPSVYRIGLSARLQPDGKIGIVAEVLEVHIRYFKCDGVIGALAALAYFGGKWGTLAAFILNVIIAKFIGDSLPRMISSSLKDAMGKQMWTLIDLAKLDIRSVFGPGYEVREAVSREPDSLLVGLAPRDY